MSLYLKYFKTQKKIHNNPLKVFKLLIIIFSVWFSDESLDQYNNPRITKDVLVLPCTLYLFDYRYDHNCDTLFRFHHPTRTVIAQHVITAFEYKILVSPCNKVFFYECSCIKNVGTTMIIPKFLAMTIGI